LSDEVEVKLKPIVSFDRLCIGTFESWIVPFIPVPDENCAVGRAVVREKYEFEIAILAPLSAARPACSME
jgi:hypothetical protein